MKKERMVKRMVRSSVLVLSVFVLVCSLVFLTGVPVVMAAPTTVGVNPVSQTVLAGDTFNITVSCAPQQAVKAFELKVSFNPSLLQATSVLEGDIFEGFTTFFNPGVIDNTAGTIVNIFDLIVGVGTVTDAGGLVLITFTAKSLNGTSGLSLYDVRVTNESDYVEVSVSSGAVTVTGGSTPSFYTITATAGTGGRISPAGSVLVNAGANQVFAITHDSGYEILGVLVDGVSVGAVLTYTFSNVVADHTLAASFTSSSGPPDGPPSSDENTAPSAPLQPVGLTRVEVGALSGYHSAAIDPDGDRVRLRFDWGDGSLSNWTVFVASNTSVNASHAWGVVSNQSIRVIAQDTSGVNSSWSDPLMVIISEEALNGSLPVGMFTVPENASSNQSLVFDTSGVYDPDGQLVSYQWDFGDGAVGVGENPVHSYQYPGTYTVMLTVIDNTGLAVTMTKVVTIIAGSEAEVPTGNVFAVLQSNSHLIILAVVVIPLLVVLVVFRDRIEKVYVERQIDSSRRRLALGLGPSDTVFEIDQIIDKLFSEVDLMRHTPSKETILNAYGDFIVGAVEENPTYHPPDVSIEEIERRIDRRIQAKIEEEVDKL